MFWMNYNTLARGPSSGNICDYFQFIKNVEFMKGKRELISKTPFIGSHIRDIGEIFFNIEPPIEKQRIPEYLVYFKEDYNFKLDKSDFI